MMPAPNSSKPLSIVITGATSGIGLQLAMDYLSQGHEVYTVGRNSDVLHTLATKKKKTIQIKRLRTFYRIPKHSTPL